MDLDWVQWKKLCKKYDITGEEYFPPKPGADGKPECTLDEWLWNQAAPKVSTRERRPAA